MQFAMRMVVMMLIVSAMTLSVIAATAGTTETAQPTADVKKAEKTGATFDKERAEKEGMVEFKLDLPKPVFKGTPKDMPKGLKLDKKRMLPDGKLWERPMAYVGKDVELLSAEKPVTASDKYPLIGDLEQVTDGDREGADGSFVELAWGKQWVQIDLEEAKEIHAMVVWHYHSNARVYRDVVIQVSEDPDFVEGVTTVFNNDFDNSAGLGKGEDYEWVENYQGELITFEPIKARYARLWSNGSTEDDQNHYTEVEIYGK